MAGGAEAGGGSCRRNSSLTVSLTESRKAVIALGTPSPVEAAADMPLADVPLADVPLAGRL